ncbi:glycosyltransferase family 2 protein [Oenococcus sicerae]|uniref:glycosyltransferase family 2 protein n=1 Tax=Oenococcus sicerae TaxID=2203724 RepID=UPI0039E90C59
MVSISVIVPVYNLEKYISQCIASLKNQTFNDFEIIVINDGSTDRSLERIKLSIGTDDRFRVFTTKNSGQSKSRIKGIAEAKGKYFTFLDGDDFVSKTYLELLLASLLETHSDLSVIGYDLYFDKNDRHIAMSNPKLRFTVQGKDIITEWISSQHFEGFLWGKLFKKKLFDDIFVLPVPNYMEDVDLINHLISRVNRLAYSGISLYHYRQRSDSTVHRGFSGREFNGLLVIDNMMVLAGDDVNLIHLVKARKAKTILNIMRDMSLQDNIIHTRKLEEMLKDLRNMTPQDLACMADPFKTFFIKRICAGGHIFFWSRINSWLIYIKHCFNIVKTK